MLPSLILSVWKLLTDRPLPFDVSGEDLEAEEAPAVPSPSDADPMSTYWETYDAMRPVYSKNLG
jgi:hypothetical protein